MAKEYDFLKVTIDLHNSGIYYSTFSYYDIASDHDVNEDWGRS